MDVDYKEKTEIEIWRHRKLEASARLFVENLLGQARDASLFWEKLQEYDQKFDQAATILELGAGQGWASCILKKLWPGKMVVSSDLAPGAAGVAARWERVYDVELDGKLWCRSYALSFPENSFDLVFCFQAAHHFGRHDRTLIKLHRITADRGSVLYLHGPGSRSWLASLARRRMTSMRPDVPEDVLIYPRIAALASEAGFRARINLVPTITNKDFIATVYFRVLQGCSMLRRVLPCIVDVVLEKGSNPT